MTTSQKHTITKIAVELSRVIVGITFTASGFLKAVDPLGTAYKIDDYLSAMDLSWLHIATLPTAMVLSGVEFLIGVSLLLGLYRRLSTKLALITMLIFTPFSLYIAIFSPVADCGCFGDAFIISNQETLGKNIVLLACTFILWGRHAFIYPLFTYHVYWLASLYSFFFITIFMLWNYLFLPIFDFRPYKEGANLQQLKQQHTAHTYKNTFIYEKNGEKHAFSEENYPWQDSTWHFIEMKTTLLNPGETSPIADFEMLHWQIPPQRTSINGQTSITDEVLSDTSYTFLMIAPLLSQMSESRLGDLEDIYFFTKEHGYKFYVLTASSPTEILQYIDKTGVNYHFCETDLRVLKTMIRSNPGLILIKEGTILYKWANRNIPSEQQLANTFLASSPPQITNKKQTNMDKVLTLSAIFAIPLLLIQLIDFIGYKRATQRTHTTLTPTEDKKDALSK